MSAVPFTYQPRTDTRTSNIRIGIWLLLASELMLFGSLFSAYAMLRAGAAAWTSGRAWLEPGPTIALSALLVAASVLARRRLGWSAGAGIGFLGVALFEYSRLLAAGVRPASDVATACWFVLSGVHWVHVAAGVAATLWVRTGTGRLPAAHTVERLHALGLYWRFVDLIWIAILIAFLF